MIDIENYKNKIVVASGENAFTTPPVTLNVFMNDSTQRYYIADFSSLYSGAIRFHSIGTAGGSGGFIDQRLILVDENGIETSIGHLWNADEAISALAVQAGQVYKIYAETGSFYGGTSSTVTGCYFTGAVVDTFCPVYIKA